MNYDELEAKVIQAIDDKKSPSFAQEISPEFAMPNLKPKDSIIYMGIGGGISGIVSSAFEKFIPVSIPTFGINGLVPIIAGTAIKLVLKPSGKLDDVTNGLIVAGISEAVSGFTGSATEQVREEPKNTQIQTGVIY